MTEKDYLLLLKKKLKEKRVVCGFNPDIYGKAIVTTGIPKEYSEGQVTYENQKTLNYEDYMIKQFQQSRTR